MVVFFCPIVCPSRVARVGASFSLERVVHIGSIESGWVSRQWESFRGENSRQVVINEYNVEE